MENAPRGDRGRGRGVHGSVTVPRPGGSYRVDRCPADGKVLRLRFLAYLQGLLGSVKRKNGW